ncbi:MAG: TetR/AcrR family transcriptional regulator [Actinomycetia bacterium]|nr:TetR/AcrR family transcriptional regulator [Actinomycetes bacterium]
MATPGPKRDLDAKERILRATRELIAERGPGQVTVNRIAAEARVGKQTIYRWWPTRSAVVLDSLDEVLDLGNPRDHWVSARAAVRDDLRRAGLLLSSKWGAVVRELVAEAQVDADVARQLENRVLGPRKARTMVSLRVGVERGEIAPDVDLHVAVDLLYGGVLTGLVTGGAPITMAGVDQFFDLAWSGLGARGLTPISSGLADGYGAAGAAVDCDLGSGPR